MKIFASLNRQQREAVGLLQIGTFLEDLDLGLFVHLAIILNVLFFPQTDPHTAALLAAFALCSTYVLRPFGALIFGWIGDNIGRKPTVIITTMMMAISCVIMAMLPTYEEIGITAAWLMLICRGVQGISSMCETISAEVYLTEITQEPLRTPLVASIRVVNEFGPIAAISIASLATIQGMNWRIAFWIGTTIAVVGSIARVRLRESPEFVNAKNLNEVEKKKKCDFKVLAAYFFIQAAYPYFFYITYIFCSEILKTKFNYTPHQIIKHNLIISFVALISSLTLGLLSFKYNALKLLRIRFFLAFTVAIITPLQLLITQTPFSLMLLQFSIIGFSLFSMPGVAIFFKHIPVLKRMSCASFTFATARALMFCVVSFGSVYLTEQFNYYGLWIISIPVCLGFMWGVNHFQKLESGHAFKKVKPISKIETPTT